MMKPRIDLVSFNRNKPKGEGNYKQLIVTD